MSPPVSPAVGFTMGKAPWFIRTLALVRSRLCDLVKFIRSSLWRSSSFGVGAFLHAMIVQPRV